MPQEGLKANHCEEIGGRELLGILARDKPPAILEDLSGKITQEIKCPQTKERVIRGGKMAPPSKTTRGVL
jgi:hypothetical protein